MSDQNIQPILPWGVVSQQVQPGSLKTITKDKLASFAVGQQKKSRFQKAREEKEIKKKQEEEETAKIYEGFVHSFSDSDKSKTFLKSGGDIYKLDSSNNSSSSSSSISSTKPYNKPKNSEMDRLFNEMKDRDDKKGGNLSRINEIPKEGQLIARFAGKQHIGSKMDDFMQEMIKSNTTSINESNYPGDDISTNLHVGNISPLVAEEGIFDLFSKYGSINSIKIMWPRTEEERLLKRNFGFVSFKNRKDAERAKEQLDGIIYEDYKMNLSWSKPVKIHSAPFVLPGRVENQNFIVTNNDFSSSKIDNYSDNLTISSLNNISHNSNNTIEMCKDIMHNSKFLPIEKEMDANDISINIEIPQDRKLLAIINLTAKFVAADGEAFEQTLKNREANNTDYNFLYLPDSLEGKYYRWMTYEYIQGGSEKIWRTKPFQMIINGPFLVPPPLIERERSRSRSNDNNKRKRASSIGGDKRRRSRSSDNIKYLGMTGAQIEREKSKKRKKKNNKALSDEDYNEFELILKNITISKESIKHAMGFTFDKIDSSKEIVCMIKYSLLDRDTPPPVKIARLYLISDILHNSGAPIKNASHYRILIQDCLPEIFEEFGSLLRNSSYGRMTARQVEIRVLGLLAVWMDWSIFPSTYIYGLESTFLQTENEYLEMKLLIDKDLLLLQHKDKLEDDSTNLQLESLKRKAKSFGISVNNDSNLCELQRKLNFVEQFIFLKQGNNSIISVSNKTVLEDNVVNNNNNNDDDIDGIAIDDDDNDDVDGVPLEDFNIIPHQVDYDDDIDGVAMDDDIDGIAMDDNDIDGVQCKEEEIVKNNNNSSDEEDNSADYKKYLLSLI